MVASAFFRRTFQVGNSKFGTHTVDKCNSYTHTCMLKMKGMFIPSLQRPFIGGCRVLPLLLFTEHVASIIVAACLETVH